MGRQSSAMIDIPPPFDSVWFAVLIGTAVGLCLGSFITMLSYRLPRRISLLKPLTSFCPNCKTNLKARDLVPLYSWLKLQGMCRYCETPIGLRYLIIEIVTAALTAAVFILWFPEPALAVAVLAIITIVTLTVILLERKR